MAGLKPLIYFKKGDFIFNFGDQILYSGSMQNDTEIVFGFGDLIMQWTGIDIVASGKTQNTSVQKKMLVQFMNNLTYSDFGLLGWCHAESTLWTRAGFYDAGL